MGVICKHCQRDMEDATGCIRVNIDTKKGSFKPIPYGKEKRYGDTNFKERCHDCGVMIRSFHHPGCDWEECPDCGLQLISCGCIVQEDKNQGDNNDRMENI